MRIEIDIAEHHYNNIMALDSVSLGRVPYKGIIMYSINAIKHGRVLEQEPTTKNNLGVDCISREKALGAIRNLYPSMPRVDFNGSLRKWVDKYKPYIECDDAIKQLPSVTPQLSVPEVTALAEWTARLTKASEDAYNKGYADGRKEQEPRKGHWIGHGEHCENLGVIPSGLGAYEWCSNCDCGIDVGEWHRNHYNYCPNCGADMREVEDGNGD